MATVEHGAGVQQRVPRTRTDQLADQAATAALYVTHPERRASLREPPPKPDVETLKATGSRPGFSHASAVAAVAHAQRRERGAVEATPPQPASQGIERRTAVIAVAQARTREREAVEAMPPPPPPSQRIERRTALVAVANARTRERRAVDSTSLLRDVERRHATESPTQAAVHALRERRATATLPAGQGPGGVVYGGNRRRADSAPNAGAVVEGVGDPFKDLDMYLNASRIQNLTHPDRRLFTATPPIAPELAEHRRRSILEAASISMARDTGNVVEAKDVGLPGPMRAGSQRSASKPDALLLQQAVSLQDVAQKRAAERLASLEDESAMYREYYGIEQTTRTSFSLRKRRDSDDTEVYDVERSREIRTQMSTLRTKVEAVDEKREKDRATLLELARKNVDAVIQDMETRVYNETGRAPAAMQKDLEETAAERGTEGKREIDLEYPTADRVNIGWQKYVDMADVEDLARSRLQPTFDEINEMAETQRARETEERLDEEQRQRWMDIEREREADLRMEEKRHKAFLKQGAKSKEERWPWKRPREQREAAPSGQAEERAVASDAVGEMEPVTKQESKLKSWFKDRLGRRTSAAPAEPSKEPTAGEAVAGTGPDEGVEGAPGVERAEEVEEEPRGRSPGVERAEEVEEEPRGRSPGVERAEEVEAEPQEPTQGVERREEVEEPQEPTQAVERREEVEEEPQGPAQGVERREEVEAEPQGPTQGVERREEVEEPQEPTQAVERREEVEEEPQGPAQGVERREEVEAEPQEPTPGVERAEEAGAEADRAQVATGKVHEEVELEPEAQRAQIAHPPPGAAHAPEGNARGQALRSHPVTAQDRNNTVKIESSDGDTDRLHGMTPSEYMATRRDSQEMVEYSSEMKHKRQQDTCHELPAPSTEREALRESAAEHGLTAPPPVGEPIGKRMSNGMVRESRFSENL